MARKFLWTVDIPDQSAVDLLLGNAQIIGAYAVLINTKNALLNQATMDQFHAAGVKVYGWRWPAVKPGTYKAPHYYAMDEANHVTGLIGDGLDGYIVDPEADDDPNAVNYWNNSALNGLATQFCRTIRASSGPEFHLGITSGCSYPTTRPNIPWRQFLQFCEAAYPQSYWRADLRGIKPINGGTPSAAIHKGITSWRNVMPPGKQMIVMAGELAHVTVEEILDFAKGAAAHGVEDLHFYADDPTVPSANYDQIAALGLTG